MTDKQLAYVLTQLLDQLIAARSEMDRYRLDFDKPISESLFDPINDVIANLEINIEYLRAKS